MVKVGILIPAFNAAETLRDTIQSVRDQDFADWEAIIVDDGSIDDTADVARSLCDLDCRIRLISTPNHGVAAARNEAARHARSPWLLFLDADDLIGPAHLSSLLKMAEEDQSVGIVFSAGARLAPDGRMGEVEAPPEADHFRYLGRYNPIYMHACLVRRDVFEASGGFDPALRACEDWDLWQRLARGGVTFAGTHLCSALYRMRDKSLSRDFVKLFENARTIISRAHGPDERVRVPLPQYAQGLPACEAGEALMGIAVWCAANLIGSGRDPAEFLTAIETFPLVAPDIRRVVSMMQGGVPNGAALLESDWPALWEKYSGPIRDTFQLIGQKWQIPAFVSRCLEELAGRLSVYGNVREVATASETGSAEPAVGEIRFGDFDRSDPISIKWEDRGTPIDRLYIESFLERFASDIKGHVLEVGDDVYTRRFGQNRVLRGDVLHIDEGVSGVTIVADLAKAQNIPSNCFDCVILTQTLQYIFDLPAAIRNLFRILKPGGILLLSVPCISRLDHDRWRDSRYWSFSPAAISRLLTSRFPPDSIHVESHGNVYAAVSFLHGLSQQDVELAKLKSDDALFPLIVLARAQKPLAVEELPRTTSNSGKMKASRQFARDPRRPLFRRIVVVAAHPDDETIGVGGLLASWPDARIITVTNGAPKDLRYATEAGFSAVETYAEARRCEQGAALALAGIDGDHITNLGFDDQEASHKLVAISRELERVLAAEAPDLVITHAYEGGHPDHDATCFAVQSACSSLSKRGLSPALIEMSSYFGRDGIRITTSFLHVNSRPILVRLTAGERERKAAMYRCFSSQANTINMFPIGVECLRFAPHYSFLNPPHSGKLLYEYYDLGMDGVRWRRLAVEAQEQLKGAN